MPQRLLSGQLDNTPAPWSGMPCKFNRRSFWVVLCPIA